MTTPHILLVEDSELVTAALRVLFEETGHRVTVAASAAVAIEAATSDWPDIMLLDLGLPDEDGLAVLDALAARGERIPVTIALTGDGDDATVRRCIERGCREVLLKPVAPRELLARVGWWLAAD